MYKPSYIKKCNASSEFKDNPPNLSELTQKIREIPKFQNFSDLKLLSHIRISISNSCCNKYLEHQSMEDMFLIAYMKEQHGVDWFESSNMWK